MNEEITKRLTEIEENLINAIKEHISNLRTEFRYKFDEDKVNEKPKNDYFLPGNDEWYFYITTHGDIEQTKNNNMSLDQDLIRNFNFYKTIEIAEKEANFLRTYRKLRHIARELNGDWVLDPYNGHQIKWGFYFDAEKYDFVCSDVYSIDIGNIYFKTEDAAKKALSLLTNEEIETLKKG